jgi:hypothetical protein
MAGISPAMTPEKWFNTTGNQGAHAEAERRTQAREHDAGRGKGLAGALCSRKIDIQSSAQSPNVSRETFL